MDTMKKSYKKLDHRKFAEVDFQLQPFLLNLPTNQARQKFRLRSFMTKTVKMNYPNDIAFRKQSWKCFHCPNIDTQSHVRFCPAYEHLRLNKDFDDDKDLVTYYQQVIAMREDEVDL